MPRWIVWFNVILLPFQVYFHFFINNWGMISNILRDKPTRLFVILPLFVANALIAECIGTKIFSLEALWCGALSFQFAG